MTPRAFCGVRKAACELKKGICILLAGVLACLFVSCAKTGSPQQEKPPELPSAFSADMTVAFGTYEILSKVDFAPEHVEIKFQKPDALKKMSMTYDGEAYALKYEGLSITVDARAFPETAFSVIMVQALRKGVDQDSLTVTKTQEGWLYKGMTNSGEFELIQDAQTGMLRVLRAPSLKLAIAFDNVKVKSAK